MTLAFLTTPVWRHVRTECPLHTSAGRRGAAGSGLRGRVMSRQDRADAVDREMAARLLPDATLQALGRW